MKLYWNFQRGGAVLEKNPFRGGMGYFLELHNTTNIRHSYARQVQKSPLRLVA